LGEAEAQEVADLQMTGESLAGGGGEVLVLLLVALAAFHRARGIQPTLDAADEAGQAAEIEPEPHRQRELAALPGEPVHEEQDVPGLFLDHRLEGLDQS